MRKNDTQPSEARGADSKPPGTGAPSRSTNLETFAAADTRSQPACTVVLVDDDEDLVASLRELLEEENFAVEAFTDAHAALERLKHGTRPDVLLVDFVMPQMDGGEFLGACDGAGLDVPAVLFTAMNDIGPRPRRAVSILRKPFELDALLDELGRVRRAA